MPRLKSRSLVSAPIESVYEHVTAFPSSGPADQKALEDKYGRLLKRDGNTLTFQENPADKISWQYTFEPPKLRRMRALESSWSDRTDLFEPAQGGTLWTIIWELKARGLPAYVQWLVFHLKDKRRVRRTIVLPVLQHFQQASRQS